MAGEQGPKSFGHEEDDVDPTNNKIPDNVDLEYREGLGQPVTYKDRYGSDLSNETNEMSERKQLPKGKRPLDQPNP
jgi:hypothetical protein